MPDDHMNAQLADFWAGPLTSGNKPRSYAAVAAHYRAETGDSLSQTRAKEAILSAFKKRNVRFERDLVAKRYERTRDLEERLNRWKPNVEFIVVRSATDDVSSDEAHYQLADALAAHLRAHRKIFDSVKKIGVGAGRSVNYLARALSKTQLTIRRSVALHSLTGRIHPISKHRSVKEIVDADANVILFKLLFESSSDQLIPGPVAPSDMREGISKTWLGFLDDGSGDFSSSHYTKIISGLGAGNLQKLIPELCFFGVGAFNKNHEMYKIAREEYEAYGFEYINPIRDSLKRLADICDDVEGRYQYCPVGDCCNRMFTIQIPTEVPETPELLLLQIKIQELVHELNDKLITSPKTLLSFIRKKVMISGTPSKFYAIREVLSRNVPRVNLVCTDHAVASRLLEGE